MTGIEPGLSVPTGTVAAGTLNSMMIREEINEAGVRVANSEQIVLEYAVHADYQFVVDTQLAPGSAARDAAGAGQPHPQRHQQPPPNPIR